MVFFSKSLSNQLFNVYLSQGVLCKYIHAQCAGWADSGECESNPGWMMRNCMKSCKSTSCDENVKIPPGQCANPLGLSRDINGNSKIPDSSFLSSSHLVPGNIKYKSNAKEVEHNCIFL